VPVVFTLSKYALERIMLHKAILISYLSLSVPERLKEQNGKPHKPPVPFEDAIDLAGN
jgi:hypothetical protein